jgi:hypothetical protein
VPTAAVLWLFSALTISRWWSPILAVAFRINFHVDDVIAAINTVRLVPTDEHANLFRDALSGHVADASSSQIVEVKPDVFRLFLRVAHLASATISDDLLAVAPQAVNVGARCFVSAGAASPISCNVGSGLYGCVSVVARGRNRTLQFWDYFRQAFQNNRGIRIDHFLLSPTLADRLESCEIDRGPRAQEKPSDHTPIIVTLSDLK